MKMKFLGSKTIETNRLILRATEEEDLKPIWEILCIAEVNKYYLTCKLSFDWEKEKPWQYKKLQKAKNKDKFQWSIILKSNNECVGQISVHEAHDEDEEITDKSIRGIGWFINPKYQRQGLTYEASSAILEYMFNEVEIEKIKTGAAIENEASWKLMEKLGFIKDKKNTKKLKYTFVDKPVEMYLYNMDREDYQKKKGVTNE